VVGGATGTFTVCRSASPQPHDTNSGGKWLRRSQDVSLGVTGFVPVYDDTFTGGPDIFEGERSALEVANQRQAHAQYLNLESVLLSLQA